MGAGLVATMAAALVQVAGTAVPAPDAADVVVTAAARAQTVAEAPASLSVISADDLARWPIRDIADVLEQVEGVTLRRAGNQRLVQLRGLPSAYTLFMIDGKRVSAGNAAFRGNDFDADWVPAEAIERIEVVRGPLSSLYGTDAIGGAVNVITRPVGTAWHGSLSDDLVAQQDRSRGGYGKAGGFVSGPLVPGRLGVKTYAGYDVRAADRRPHRADGTVLPGLDRVTDYVADATLAWTPGARDTVSLDLGRAALTHGATPLTRGSAALTYAGAADWGEWQVRGDADRIRNAAGNVTGQRHPNRADDATLDARLTLPAARLAQTLVLGGDHRHQALYDPASLAIPSGAAAVSQWALFAQDEWRLATGWQLTLGDRYDHHARFGGHHSPRVYLLWQPAARLTLKGGWGRAFRAPTLLQNSPGWGSVSCGSATSGCYIVGSPLLRPETSASYETALRYDAPALTAAVTLYRTDLDDQITIENRTRDRALAPAYANFVGFLPDGRPIFRYENVARAQSRGVEASARVAWGRSWTLSGNYTYLDARNRVSGRALPSIFAPRHSAHLTLDGERKSVGWYASASFIGHQYLAAFADPRRDLERAGYATLDGGARVRLGAAATLRAGVLDVFDHKRRRLVSADYDEDGRRLFVATTLRF
jgi:outer membrane receptor for ferrienterochelin and colicins